MGKYKEKCHKNCSYFWKYSWQPCDWGRRAGQVLLLTLPRTWCSADLPLGKQLVTGPQCFCSARTIIWILDSLRFWGDSPHPNPHARVLFFLNRNESRELLRPSQPSLHTIRGGIFLWTTCSQGRETSPLEARILVTSPRKPSPEGTWPASSNSHPSLRCIFSQELTCQCEAALLKPLAATVSERPWRWSFLSFF